MAIRHLYTILCDYLVVGQDGRPTAAGIFHNIEFDQLPGARSFLGIVVGLMGEDGDVFRVTLDDPDGECMAELATSAVEKPTDLREHQQWAYTATGLAAPAVFPKAGVYSVCIWEGREKIHAYPFGVLLKGQVEGEKADA